MASYHMATEGAPGHLIPRHGGLGPAQCHPAPPLPAGFTPAAGLALPRAGDSLGLSTGKALTADQEVGHTHAMGTPQGRPLQLQVLGMLAMLSLGAVMLTYLLWQMPHLPTWGQLRVEEAPARPRGRDSSPAWETPGGEAARPQWDSCQ